MYFQNPHRTQPVSLKSLVKSVVNHRQLILQMVKRDVVGRYKGSFLGLAWSFLNPIFMLTIYTFVFSVVFKAKWGGAEESKTQFAIFAFTGMIVQSLFAETINRAPGLILGNINYVKKVVFPLELLPIISIGSSIFHAFVSLIVLVITYAVIKEHIHWTVFYAPIVLMPLVLLTLGISWFLASIGVYMRDVGQSIGLLTTVLMFMSPVFYPVTALPPRFQNLILLNPLTFIIEQCRDVLINGLLPNWGGLVIYYLVSIIFLWGGYFWFQKTRKGFSDVI
jgi:lipopolysaccharide transport system permease protein